MAKHVSIFSYFLAWWICIRVIITTTTSDMKLLEALGECKLTRTLRPIQSGSSVNWRVLTLPGVTTDNLKFVFPQLLVSKCTANGSQDLFTYSKCLPRTLTRYSIHIILSLRPPVGSKYISVWLYLVIGALPKPVFPGDDGQQHLWCSGAPY